MKRINENKVFKHWVYLAGPSSQRVVRYQKPKKKKDATTSNWSNQKHSVVVRINQSLVSIRLCFFWKKITKKQASPVPPAPMHVEKIKHHKKMCPKKKASQNIDSSSFSPKMHYYHHQQLRKSTACHGSIKSARSFEKPRSLLQLCLARHHLTMLLLSHCYLSLLQDEFLLIGF